MTETPADTETQSSLATMKADMVAALAQKQLEDEQQTEAAHNTEQAVLAEPPVDADGNIVLDEVQTSRVIEMAWEDRTPFAAIEHSYGLDETAVIKLMRHELKPSSFRLWRERVTGRNTKHEAKRDFEVGRAYSKTQYKPR
nr:TIGR03643 family protein [uncultured Psychrobacter sp.]